MFPTCQASWVLVANLGGGSNQNFEEDLLKQFEETRFPMGVLDMHVVQSQMARIQSRGHAHQFHDVFA
jgi:hypothetical protein